MADSTQGLISALGEHRIEQWDDPVRGRLGFLTLFSGDSTATRELTTGFAIVPPGGWLGLHRHSASETYFVIEGSGVVVLDGNEHAVGAGSTVFIPGDTVHGCRNTGSSDLRVFYAFAAHSMSDIHYDFVDADVSDVNSEDT